MDNVETVLKNGAEEIESVKDAMDDVIKQSVKEEHPEMSEEEQEQVASEEANRSTMVLYHGIVDNVTANLKDEAFIQSVSSLINTYEKDHNMAYLVTQLIKVVSIMMIQCSYGAAVIYDNLMKEELTATFNEFADTMNKVSAEVNGQGEALRVFRKELSNIKHEKMIAKMGSSIKPASEE